MMIMLQLRERTRAHHDRMEQNVDISERCGSLESYRLLLEKFYGFYAPVEAALGSRSDWESSGLDFNRRRKVPLLRADLRALGVCNADLDRLPHCSYLPNLNTTAQALGCLYVLEGATLGGQIIARQIKAALNIDRHNGGAFFCSYGNAVGAMWKSFGGALTAYSSAHAVEEIIIGSACDTFTTLDRWLREGTL